uniref:Uncharacterized protein n=1 Tax=Pseudomonas phage HRDY3 TaxID=3236930 RepID=A0AB39CDZ4_9VIRU
MNSTQPPNPEEIAPNIVQQMLGRIHPHKPLPSHVDIPGEFYGWPLRLVPRNCSTCWELGEGPDQEWIENNPLNVVHLTPNA